MKTVAGIGFNSGVTAKSLDRALTAAMQAAGVAQIDALATPRHKAGDPTLLAFAARLGLPVLAVDVAGVATPSHSSRVQALFGTGSVAEAAAIASLPKTHLLARKTPSPCGRATAAIACEVP